MGNQFGFVPDSATATPAQPSPAAPVLSQSSPAAPAAASVPAPTPANSLGFIPDGGASPSPSNTPASPASAAPSYGPVPTLFPLSANDSETPLETAAKVVGNIPGSAINFGIGALKMPFQLAGAAAQAPGAVASDIGQNGVLGGIKKASDDLDSYLYQNLVPSLVKRGVDVAAGGLANLLGPALNKPGAGNSLIDAGIQGGASDLVNDPVGSIAPILLAGRGVAEAAGPEVAEAFDRGVSKVAAPGVAVANAVGTAAGKATDLAGAVARYGTAQITGLDPSSVQRIISIPGDFSTEKMEKTTRISIASDVKNALDAHDEATAESGQAYNPIRQSPNMISLEAPRVTLMENPTDTRGPTLADMITKNTGLVQNAQGDFESNAMSKVDAPGDVSKVNRFYQQWQPYFDQGQMLPKEFLTMRGKLADIANYEGIGKSSALESGAAGIRSDLNDAYRDQIEGLSEKDADFTARKVQRKQLGNGLLDKENNLRDSDINKIANATGLAKTQLLAQLEELVPGITDRLNALKAIEDINKTEGHKVGTYARSFGTGGAVVAGLATGHLPLLIGGITEAVLASPKVAVPLLRAYGYSKELVTGVAANLATIGRAINHLPEGSEKSLGQLSPRMQELGAKATTGAKSYFQKNPVGLGLSMRDVSGDAAYGGEKDLSLKTLEDLKGRTTVSKQYIADATNRGDIKQPERDVIRETLKDFPDTVPVKQFADAVKTQLLPLKRTGPFGKYEEITLPDRLRGPVADYGEHIYNSPIKTSAGGVHYSSNPFDEYGMKTKDAAGYFAHTRTEDLPNDDPSYPTYSKGTTRRVIELQSDLFQKGNLEAEKTFYRGNPAEKYLNPQDAERMTQLKKDITDTRIPAAQRRGNLEELSNLSSKALSGRIEETSKLEPYRNTWHERIIREEVKQAAKDGKTKLQFPTGETAMKVEGLGRKDLFSNNGYGNPQFTKPEDLAVGKKVYQQGIGNHGDGWIVTKVLGDGKFKAVPENMEQLKRENPHATHEMFNETFDISGKGDPNNPIYKFYEKEVGKYLKNKYGAEQVTDPQGVKWWQVDVNPAQKKLPISAYGIAGASTATLARGLMPRKQNPNDRK